MTCGHYGSAGKESACNGGDLGSIPGLERSPGKGKDYSLQYYGPENSMDCIIHGVSKSQILPNDFHFQNIREARIEEMRKEAIFIFIRYH